MYYSKCHGELAFLAFSGFRPTATRLRSCFCYSWLKASTVLPKEALISLSANSSTSLKRLSDFVRLVGRRLNIYSWILAFGLILGTVAEAFKPIAWWEAVTTAVLPGARAAWALWALRSQSAAG